MAFRIRIDPVALRQIDQLAVYLRDYSEDFSIKQIERLDRILCTTCQVVMSRRWLRKPDTETGLTEAIYRCP
jgi:hypothetical protein